MGRYDDIIALPHHVSARHPQMPRGDRAAQFSPFAALTGLEATLQETARLTDRRITLDEYEQAALNARLQTLRDTIKTQPQVTVTYFVADAFKEGGTYCTAVGKAKKLTDENKLVFTDGTTIPVPDILALELV